MSLLEKCPERVAQCEQALARMIPPAKLEAAFQQEVIWDLLTQCFMTFEGGHLQPKCTQPARRALQSDSGPPGSSYFGWTPGARPGAHKNKVVHHIFVTLAFHDLIGQYLQERLRTIKSSL